jgi:hypothetical protein
MPLYEDLALRALAAKQHAAGLHVDSQRARALAQMLREAHAGERLLKRCAWCDRLEVGTEWLHLEAIGAGEHRIATSLMIRATHGICPDCYRRQSRRPR